MIDSRLRDDLHAELQGLTRVLYMYDILIYDIINYFLLYAGFLLSAIVFPSPLILGRSPFVEIINLIES